MVSCVRKSPFRLWRPSRLSLWVLKGKYKSLGWAVAQLVATSFGQLSSKPLPFLGQSVHTGWSSSDLPFQRPALFPYDSPYSSFKLWTYMKASWSASREVPKLFDSHFWTPWLPVHFWTAAFLASLNLLAAWPWYVRFPRPSIRLCLRSQDVA